MDTVIKFVKEKKYTPHPSTQYWSICKVESLFEIPFLDLVHKAASIHREFFNSQKIQLSTLLSIKTGGCPEDCSYCPQSAKYNTNIKNHGILKIEDIIEKAKIAKARGASRFCIGAAWRGPKLKSIEKITEIIKSIKELGLETCGTFGLLEEGMAEKFKEAGLDYYNHNIDTSPENYKNIITTRNFKDRIDTLGKIRKAGLKVCCGGIVGMEKQRKDRAGLLASLANLDPQPESVPINKLVKVKGTPLENNEDLDWTEFVRTIAVARIIMPKSYIRIAAGREGMEEGIQAMCFMAGANSIFYGDKLLVTENNNENDDEHLMKKLDLFALKN